MDNLNNKLGLYYFNMFAWNNQQLVKNCGALAYVFQKKYNFNSVMVGNKTSRQSNLDRYIPGVEMDFYPSDDEKGRLEYIASNAEKIDLMVLHNHFEVFGPMVKLYKELRPDGKIYLETDTNYMFQDRFVLADKENRDFLLNCDVVGVSCRKLQKFLSKKWPCKLEYIPNGFYNFSEIDITKPIDWNKKENIIITVGRLGTYQKNTELLVEAFSVIYKALPDWKLQLVGSMTDSFKNYLKKKFSRMPELRKRIVISGIISDKIELMNAYRKAKIFALSSIYEGGTPNVIAEALFNGCCIVTSDIDGSIDATDNGKCGECFPINDLSSLVKILLKVCTNDNYLKGYCSNSVEYAKQKLDFEKIMDRLYYLLYH